MPPGRDDDGPKQVVGALHRHRLAVDRRLPAWIPCVGQHQVAVTRSVDSDNDAVRLVVHDLGVPWPHVRRRRRRRVDTIQQYHPPKIRVLDLLHEVGQRLRLADDEHARQDTEILVESECRQSLDATGDEVIGFRCRVLAHPPPAVIFGKLRRLQQIARVQQVEHHLMPDREVVEDRKGEVALERLQRLIGAAHPGEILPIADVVRRVEAAQSLDLMEQGQWRSGAERTAELVAVGAAIEHAPARCGASAEVAHALRRSEDVGLRAHRDVRPGQCPQIDEQQDRPACPRRRGGQLATPAKQPPRDGQRQRQRVPVELHMQRLAFDVAAQGHSRHQDGHPGEHPQEIAPATIDDKRLGRRPCAQRLHGDADQ